MTDPIYTGTTVITRVRFYDVSIVDGVQVRTLADPTTVELHIQPTIGDVISYTFGASGSPIEREDIGIYTATIIPGIFGTHWVRWEGSGNFGAVIETSFDVERGHVRPQE